MMTVPHKEASKYGQLWVRGFLKRIPLFAIILLSIGSYYKVKTQPLVWESRTPTDPGGIVLHIDRNTEVLTLQGPDLPSFWVARGRQTARDSWKKINLPEGLAHCSNERDATKPATSSNGNVSFTCVAGADRIEIKLVSIPEPQAPAATPVPKATPTAAPTAIPAASPAAPAPSSQPAPTTTSTAMTPPQEAAKPPSASEKKPPPEDRYHELVLIPYRATNGEPARSPVVRWNDIKWKAKGANEPEGIRPAECEAETAGKKALCGKVEQTILGARLRMDQSPEQTIASKARDYSKTVAPVVVQWMIYVIDALLGCLGLAGVAWCLTNRGLQKTEPFFKFFRTVSRPPTEEITDASLIWNGFRRLLEWLEVIGPALGFLLTVAALTVAFDPSIFADRKYNEFTEALSLAMGATVVGLAIRILAFTLDRAIDHLARWDADRYGLVMIPPDAAPEAAPSNNGGAPSAGGGPR